MSKKNEIIAGTEENCASHTISIYVANKPGVLVRVAQVFARRGFNIDSLVVSSGMDGKFSRMTITAQGNPENIEQIKKHVSKLVDVINAIEHTNLDVIEKEMTLVKIAANNSSRTELLQLIGHFKGETLDFTDSSLIVQIAGSTEKLNAFLSLAQRFGILEIVRTGKISIARGKELT